MVWRDVCRSQSAKFKQWSVKRVYLIRQTWTWTMVAKNQIYVSPDLKLETQLMPFWTAVQHMFCCRDLCCQKGQGHSKSRSIWLLARRRPSAGEMRSMHKSEPILYFHLGRLTNLLDTKFVWEDGTAVMQCRDKGKWRTMTKFEIRNNMAYASQMQFEVLRRALWVQQAHPDTVFNWQFWERAAQDPKMTSYLSHGVKAKMCETTPFVNSVGTQYIASRAQIEQACDSLRQQGSSMHKSIGLTKDDLCPPTTLASSASRAIVEALVIPPDAMWSTMMLYTQPFPPDLLQHVRPYHEVLFSCKPHRPGCHQCTSKYMMRFEIYNLT